MKGESASLFERSWIHCARCGQGAELYDAEGINCARRIDEPMTLQAREINAERRRTLFREAQHILAEQLLATPIAARHLAAASNPRVGNNRPRAPLPYSEELFVRRWRVRAKCVTSFGV